MAANRFTGLRADLDIYATFEGDNNVLLQLVGKRLLGDFAAQFKGIDAAGMAGYALRTVSEAVLERTGLRALGQEASDAGSGKRSAKALKDPEVQRALLTERVSVAVGEIGRALQGVAKASPAERTAAFNEHQHDLILAAAAHGRLLQWEAFTRGIEAVEDDGSRRVLTWLRDLFALSTIEEELGWYLMHGRLSAQRARTLVEYVGRLVSRLRPHAQDLVDAFGYTQEHLRAPLSSGEERVRQEEAAEYYRQLRAAPDSPVDEKVLLKRRRAERRATQAGSARAH